ncbi:MAG: helix-turn-helix domain-containing protein [Opitutaceae bacterium]|jgi:transcriptional regulator with XRE-family HTH domain|nr:helix-turn-helix domain-containing protein [Opitutaceae bacterium]
MKSMLQDELSRRIATGSALTIAQNIRRVRLSQNITQSEIARRAGLSLRTYQTFEQTGEIHLMKFLEVLRGLGRLSEFVNAAAILQPRTPEEATRLENRRERASPGPGKRQDQ